MDPQKPVPPPPPLSNYRPSFERAPLGSGPRRDKAPPPKPARRSGLLLGVIYLFLFVVLAGGAGGGLSRLQSAERSDSPENRRAGAGADGRDLVMAGPASFTFYPALGVSLHDVSLSGPPGMDGKLVQMASLEARVKVSTLLSRQVEIHSLILRNPTFDFRIDKTGRNNWHFAARETPVRFAELQTPGTRRDAEPIVVASRYRPSLGEAQSDGRSPARRREDRRRDVPLYGRAHRQGRAGGRRQREVRTFIAGEPARCQRQSRLARQASRFRREADGRREHRQQDAGAPRVQCQERRDLGFL